MARRTRLATTLPRTRSAGKNRRYTALERYQVLDLHRKNPDMAYTEIARLVDRSSDSVRQLCLAADKTLIDLMASEAEVRLDDWRKAAKIAGGRGDHRPAKEWLMHSGALDQLPDLGKGSGPQVVIINSPLPGMPGGVQIGTIDVKKLNE